MPVNLYDDPTARYDTGRLDRLNPTMHNNSYAYDLPGSQTWNPNGFANPQALGGIRSASASMKTAARGGRAALPTVRVVFGQKLFDEANWIGKRRGWTSSPASQALFPTSDPVRFRGTLFARKLRLPRTRMMT